MLGSGGVWSTGSPWLKLYGIPRRVMGCALGVYWSGGGWWLAEAVKSDPHPQLEPQNRASLQVHSIQVSFRRRGAAARFVSFPRNWGGRACTANARQVRNAETQFEIRILRISPRTVHSVLTSTLSNHRPSLLVRGVLASLSLSVASLLVLSDIDIRRNHVSVKKQRLYRT
jgi:hypothetical protein